MLQHSPVRQKSVYFGVIAITLIVAAGMGVHGDFGLQGLSFPHRGPIAASRRLEAKPHPRPKAAAISARFTR
jgi:hypothetical protein